MRALPLAGWKRVAARRPRHTLRRAAGNNRSANMSLPRRHTRTFPRRALEARPSGGVSHESSHGLMDKASPFKGEDCGFESRWEPLQLEEYRKKNAKKTHEGRPVRFLTAVGAKKSERQLNLERNHYALSAKTGRCQRRFTAGVATKTPCVRGARRAPLSERAPPRRDGVGAQLEPRDARRGRRAGGRAAITWRTRPSWLFWRPAA